MEKYLGNYAEPEAREVAGLPDHCLPDQGAWANVMVIPACNEGPGLLRPPPPCGGRSLMILVINEMESAAQHVSQRNEALAAAVQAQFSPQWQSAGLSLWRDMNTERDVLLVDRFSKGRRLPAKGGVGYARKIGVDMAVALVHARRIETRWIHCTDADVKLPETYFTSSNKLPDPRLEYSALVYPFSHRDIGERSAGSDVIEATALYELSLRYYVAGMKYAHSPYAFHTIGSTMAVSAEHYAKVRGFPKREAGEDFYLLNKLAKVGTVLELESGPDNDVIEIQSRRSDRVPFGTGAAVNKITELKDLVSDFLFYDPAVFELLGIWLGSLPKIWGSESPELTMASFSKGHCPENQQQALLAGLEGLKTQQALEHAFRQSKNLDQFNRQMHTWFDAFRTLKLIHFLRDRCLPSIPYDRLENNPVFQVLLTRDTDLLAFQEGLDKSLQTKQ